MKQKDDFNQNFPPQQPACLHFMSAISSSYYIFKKYVPFYINFFDVVSWSWFYIASVYKKVI